MTEFIPLILFITIMDPREYIEYGRFVCQYRDEHPNASEEEVCAAYFNSKQRGKQAVNTHLSGR